MDVLRKRRASTELECLMAAVRNDYTRFVSYDDVTENPAVAAKRPRTLRITQRSKPRQSLTQDTDTAITNISNIPGCITSKTEQAKQISARKVAYDEADRLLRPVSRLTRIGFECSSVQDVWQEKAVLVPKRTLGNPSTFVSDVGDARVPMKKRRLSSASEFLQAMKALEEDVHPPDGAVHSPDGAVHSPDGVAQSVYDRIEKTEREMNQSTSNERNGQLSSPPVSTTKIIYSGLATNEATAYETAFLESKSTEDYGRMREASKDNARKETAFEKSVQCGSPVGIMESLRSFVMRHQHDAQSISASQSTQQPIVIEDDDDVVASITNEQNARKSRDRRDIMLMKAMPNYVITKVSSLLWLGKDIVYPITLEEIRRRLKDPENFSFQMLIAYVRHSRSKGRQFLNYWNCRPTGKVAHPNVLSKLCEGDARELVQGIHNVNTDYFPSEKLARNAAEEMLNKHEKAGEKAQLDGQSRDRHIRDNIRKIEKSRAVLRILETTLKGKQHDENFETFNIASHNAGLMNLQHNLKFLGSILEKVQDNIIRNGKRNLAAITG